MKQMTPEIRAYAIGYLTALAPINTDAAKAAIAIRAFEDRALAINYARDEYGVGASLALIGALTEATLYVGDEHESE